VHNVSQWPNLAEYTHLVLFNWPIFTPRFTPRLWSTLNHFRTGQGRYAAVRWNQASDPSCSCGASPQTTLHIVNDCPDMKFPGGLSALHLADEEAVAWLGMQSTH